MLKSNYSVLTFTARSFHRKDQQALYLVDDASYTNHINMRNIKRGESQNSANAGKQETGFTVFFKRNKSKVKNKATVSNTLVQFAEEDSKRIAILIQKWLQADKNERLSTVRGKIRKK